MKLKNYEIEQRLNNILSALSLIEDEKISGKVYYAIDKNIQILEPYAKEWVNFRDELIKEYGKEELDENGNATGNYVFDANAETKEKVEEFNKQLSKVAELSHTVALRTIKKKELYDYVVNPKFFALLDFMVEK